MGGSIYPRADCSLVDRFTHKCLTLTYQGKSVRFLDAKKRKEEIEKSRLKVIAILIALKNKEPERLSASKPRKFESQKLSKLRRGYFDFKLR